MKHLKLSLFLLTCIILTQLSKAEIRLPGIISSNMVLQRDTAVNLWGWANANQQITIKTSWIKKPFKVIANNNGKWKLTIHTNLSKEPQQIIFKSKDSEITLDNILFGEVWVCSGQSNMRQSLNGYKGQPTLGGNKAAALSRNSNIRLFTIREKASKTPIDTLIKHSGWNESSPKFTKDFSAIAYLFGCGLEKAIDVPVGLIMTAWGGSEIQAWMSKEGLSPIKHVDMSKVNLKKMPHHKPTALYNSMINPIIPYSIRGALWYQGESDRKQPELYKKLMPALVKDWRNKWKQGDFPFYYAQIAPYQYNDANSQYLREAQLQCLDLITNSGMAVLMDIGEEKIIHPKKKQEVADRLLFNALNKTYGYKQIDCESPKYKSMAIQDSTITISFEDTKEGIYSPEENLRGFEVAGEDKVFYPAKATIIKRKMLLISCSKVKKPVAVRYAWKNWIIGSLFDGNMLPASSFRTDNWVRIEE